MDHQGAVEAVLPVEEAVVDPGPARLGEDRPRAGQELVGVGVRVEAAMDEQRVAQPDMRAHAIEAMHDRLAQGRLEQRLADGRRRRAGARAHLVEQQLAAHALAEPHGLRLVRMRAADDGQHHHDLVVAHQPVDMVDAVRCLVGRPQLEHAHAVGPAIDHVAEIDQTPLAAALPRQFADGAQERAQLVGAAVDVADGEHRLAQKVERRGLPVGDLDGKFGGDADGRIHGRDASPIRRGAPPRRERLWGPAARTLPSPCD